ncbi:MAG: glycoside hydrolase family 140 protein [Gemmataceae bacterium]|nr:glycoside hydrolase family 140 protein [Gemmataceae bacterium]MDW8265757.1 DUF4038 domain-containing protein [Gemmataceae bacterium]
MKLFSLLVLALSTGAAVAADNPFAKHGRLRVAKSGTYLEHADGTPFFFLADTCWAGPALSTEEDWHKYLHDRVKKGFTAIQFNVVSPWRVAPTDAQGNISYILKGGQLTLHEKFYQRLDARLKAINDAGLLAVPVLCWSHKRTDAGNLLTEEQIITLCKLQVARYKEAHVMWILAGDNPYRGADADKWKRIGRAVFGDKTSALVTTHPTGENWPWNDWEDEKWLSVLGYQSGHGDSDQTWKWLHSGPPAEYGKRKAFARPVINLEPPYEGHNGYSSRKPHSDYSTRRAIYWSLLVHPPAGVTYGAHGVWSWHTKPGEEPTDHPGSGVAKVWSEAIDLPGAGQLKHLRALMNEVKWHTLRPAQEVVHQNDAPADQYTVCARAADGTYVVYFPAKTPARLSPHLSATVADVSLRWFNPRTGEWGRPANADPTRDKLSPPDDNDWVLVMKP